MYLFDVYPSHIDVYKKGRERIQKATVYQPWEKYKQKILSSEGNVVLFDETHFEYARTRIELTTDIPYPRSAYKSLISSKVRDMQQSHGAHIDLVTHHITHMQVDNRPVDRVV